MKTKRMYGGTVDASRNTILDNVKTFAISSAFKDKRYSPITLQELVKQQNINNASLYIF